MYALPGILLVLSLAAHVYLRGRNRRAGQWCLRLCFPLAGWMLLRLPGETFWQILYLSPLATLPGILSIQRARPVGRNLATWALWLLLACALVLYLLNLLHVLTSTPITRIHTLPWWIPQWLLRFMFDFPALQ